MDIDSNELIKLKKLRDKLFEAMLMDTNPENWVGYGKAVGELSKQEREEASWCRRQASSSILLWERIDKLISQYDGTSSKQLTLANIDIDSFEQEAEQLLAALKGKESDAR